jgi:hypothetical protein
LNTITFEKWRNLTERKTTKEKHKNEICARKGTIPVSLKIDATPEQ